MSPIVKSLIFVLLIMSACEKHDQILPVPPTSAKPAPSADAQISEEKEEGVPSLDFGSELYQYGNFNNMPYRILVPRGYDSAKRYPLLIFLHGISERGTDNEKQLVLGASKFQVDSIREHHPAFIIFPQCPLTEYWFSDAATDTLRNLIDAFTANNTVDKNKISLAGFSMGAYGTFAMVARNPGFFESAVAISGDGDENKASLMAKTRWQIFAGGKDAVVASSKSEKMAKALKKAGASVSLTLFPEADHGNTWAKAFSKPDFFSNLFSSDKKLPGARGK